MNIQHVHSFLFLKYNVFYSYQKHMLLFSSVLYTTCSTEGAGVPICFARFRFLTIVMKEFRWQPCHLFECRQRCCQRVPHAPEKKKKKKKGEDYLLISFFELIFMMVLLCERLCTKCGESYIDESILALVLKELSV